MLRPGPALADPAASRRVKSRPRTSARLPALPGPSPSRPRPRALQLPRPGRASATSRPRPPWVRPPSVPAPPPRPGRVRAAHAPKTLAIPALSAPLGQRPGQRGECLGCSPPAKVGAFPRISSRLEPVVLWAPSLVLGVGPARIPPTLPRPHVCPGVPRRGPSPRPGAPGPCCAAVTAADCGLLAAPPHL